MAVWTTALVLLTVAAFSVRLNADVQYVLGGLSVAGDVGWVDTFVHRPLTYRGIMAGINVLAGAVGPVADRPFVYETAVRGLAWLAAGAAGATLWLGLRRVIDPRVALASAAAAVGSLVFAPQWDVLQGEWLAALLTVAAVGAALAPRRVSVGGAAGGLLLALAAGAKLVTAPLVPVGLIVVFLLDRRRAGSLVLGTIAWGLALFAVTLIHPKEWTWALDMAVLNGAVATSLPASVIDAAHGVIDKAIASPAILLVPAAAVMLVRLAPPSRRTPLAWSIAALGLLIIVPTIAQAQFTPYHAAALPVAASVLVAASACRWWILTGRPPWVIIVGLAAAAIASTLALAAPAEWRLAWVGVLRVGAAALAVGAAFAVARAASNPGAPSWPSAGTVMLAGMVGILAFVPVMTPDAAWNLAAQNVARTNASWTAASLARRDEMRELSEAIGRDTPVLYVAYGDIAYHMGNPTDCPYPSPLWVQRGTAVPAVKDLWSYADNRRCFEHTGAEQLVLQQGWAMTGRLTADLRTDLRAFDCSEPVSVAGIRTCPRVSSDR